MSNTYEQHQHKDESDGKKILVVIVMIAALMFCTTGATFAYLSIEANNIATVNGTIATAELTLTVTQAELTEENTGVIVPQLETALGTAMSDTNKCVDGNGNIVCKAYTITVTNGSTAAVKVKGTIAFTTIPTVTTHAVTNLKWKRVSSATTVGTLSTTDIPAAAAVTASADTIDLTSGTSCTTTNNVDSAGCTQVSLAASGGTATYYIVVWLNEVNEAQNDSGAFSANIHFESQNGTGITSTITA